MYRESGSLLPICPGTPVASDGPQPTGLTGPPRPGCERAARGERW